MEIKCRWCGVVLEAETQAGDVVECPKCHAKSIMPSTPGVTLENPMPQLSMAAKPTQGIVITGVKIPFAHVLRLVYQVLLSVIGILLGLGALALIALMLLADRG